MYIYGTSQVVLVGKISSPNSEDPKDLDWILGSGRFLGEGNGNPLQYSCLKNSTEEPGRPWGCKKSDMFEHTLTHRTKHRNNQSHLVANKVKVVLKRP